MTLRRLGRSAMAHRRPHALLGVGVDRRRAAAGCRRPKDFDITDYRGINPTDPGSKRRAGDMSDPLEVVDILHGTARAGRGCSKRRRFHPCRPGLTGALATDRQGLPRMRTHPLRPAHSRAPDGTADQIRCRRFAAARQDAGQRPSEVWIAPPERRPVQDPYCLRCQPSGYGGGPRHCCQELNRRGRLKPKPPNGTYPTDPLCLSVHTRGRVLSGGNFHARAGTDLRRPIRIRGIALCEIGSLAEGRRLVAIDWLDRLRPVRPAGVPQSSEPPGH